MIIMMTNVLFQGPISHAEPPPYIPPGGRALRQPLYHPVGYTPACNFNVIRVALGANLTRFTRYINLIYPHHSSPCAQKGLLLRVHGHIMHPTRYIFNFFGGAGKGWYY